MLVNNQPLEASRAGKLYPDLIDIVVDYYVPNKVVKQNEADLILNKWKEKLLIKEGSRIETQFQIRQLQTQAFVELEARCYSLRLYRVFNEIFQHCGLTKRIQAISSQFKSELMSIPFPLKIFLLHGCDELLIHDTAILFPHSIYQMDVSETGFLDDYLKAARDDFTRDDFFFMNHPKVEFKNGFKMINSPFSKTRASEPASPFAIALAKQNFVAVDLFLQLTKNEKERVTYATQALNYTSDLRFSAMLINHGADIAAENTLISTAIRDENIPLLSVYLAKIKNINVRLSGKWGKNTALGYAIIAKKVKCLPPLIENHAKIEGSWRLQKDLSKSLQLLSFSVEHYFSPSRKESELALPLATAEVLLKYGADINAPTASGKTLFEQAILDNNLHLLKFCLQHGAKHDISVDGIISGYFLYGTLKGTVNPLLYAIHYANYEMASELIKTHPDITPITKDFYHANKDLDGVIQEVFYAVMLKYPTRKIEVLLHAISITLPPDVIGRLIYQFPEIQSYDFTFMVKRGFLKKEKEITLRELIEEAQMNAPDPIKYKEKLWIINLALEENKKRHGQHLVEESTKKAI